MDERMARSRGSMVWGVTLMLVGAGLMADRMGLAELESLWPALLVGLGVARIVARPGSTGGLWLVFGGVVLYLDQRDLVPLARSWPLALVLAGAIKIGSVLREGRREEASHGR